MQMEDWQSTFLEALEEASNKRSQYRSWVEHVGPDVPAPSELVCQLFDDSGLADLLDADRVVFSNDADRILRNLSSLVSAIDLQQSPESLLMDPGWHEFCGLAQEALESCKQALAGQNK